MSRQTVDSGQLLAEPPVDADEREPMASAEVVVKGRNVEIPDHCVLGDVNAGWTVANTMLGSERGLAGDEWPGVAELIEIARAQGRADDRLVRQDIAGADTSVSGLPGAAHWTLWIRSSRPGPLRPTRDRGFQPDRRPERPSGRALGSG